MTKLKEYRIWVHYDTGISLRVKAENEEQAIENAEALAESGDYDSQLIENCQIGEVEVTKDE